MNEHQIGTVLRLGRMGFGVHDILQLRRCAKRLSTIDVRACNGEGWCRRGEWTNLDEDAAEKKRASAIRTALTVCAGVSADLVPYHQSDPRGCSLYIIDKRDLNGKPASSVYSSIGKAVAL